MNAGHAIVKILCELKRQQNPILQTSGGCAEVLCYRGRQPLLHLHLLMFKLVVVMLTNINTNSDVLLQSALAAVIRSAHK